MTDTLIANLMRAVCEFPIDLSHRLILADVLEERGDVRGEFIRAQCELARLKAVKVNAGVAPYRSVIWSLRRRERELLWEHGFDWGRQAIPVLDGEKFTKGDDFHIWSEESGKLDLRYSFRRGFPERIRCTLAQWIGERCERCHGGRRLRHGIPDCNQCGSTGRVGGHGPAIVQASPMLRVEFSDRNPRAHSADPRRVAWWATVDDDGLDNEWQVPYEWLLAMDKLNNDISPEDRLSLVAINHARRIVRQQHGGWPDLTMEDAHR